MVKSTKCKILIAYHKPAILLKSEIMQPIHVGRDIALTKSKDGTNSNDNIMWLEQNMLGDNTGKNISKLNRYFSELTGLYWAWKNYDKLETPDYIGLMQYRRHFIFDDSILVDHKNTEIENCYSILEFNYAPDKYQRMIGLNDENILKVLAEYDYVTVKECDFSYRRIDNVKEDYVKNIEGTKEKDYDLMLQIVESKYPHMLKYLQHQLNSPKTYLYQMFILPKEEFFKYMQFLFDVLFEILDKVDFSTYTINGQRTLGYLGEKLFDCYIRYLKSETKLKHKEVISTLVYYNAPIPEGKKLKKAFIKQVFKKTLYEVRYKLTFNDVRKLYKEQYYKQKELVKIIKKMRKGNILCNQMM